MLIQALEQVRDGPSVPRGCGEDGLRVHAGQRTRAVRRHVGPVPSEPTHASVGAGAGTPRLREAPPGAPSHRRRHPMPEAAVEVDGLVKRYGATTAVDGVTFVAPTGSMLDRLGLASSARTPYRRLSGGQQQRLSLAMAVVGRPELVFLDEPTAGLDPQARRATWELLSALRADGVTVVLTTHYMEEAERLADHVVIVDAGRVVASGTPAELTRGGADRQLRFRAPPALELDRLVLALPVGSHASEVAPGQYVVEGTIDPQLLATVTAWCAAHGVLAEDLRVMQRSLEDVFLELTGRGLRS